MKLSNEFLIFLKQTDFDEAVINKLLSFFGSVDGEFSFSELSHNTRFSPEVTTRIINSLLEFGIIERIGIICNECGKPVEIDIEKFETTEFTSCDKCGNKNRIENLLVYNIRDNKLYKKIEDREYRERMATFFHTQLYNRNEVYYLIIDINKSQDLQTNDMDYNIHRTKLINEYIKEQSIYSVREPHLILGDMGDAIKILFSSYNGGLVLLKKLKEVILKNRYPYTIKTHIYNIKLHEHELNQLLRCFGRGVFGDWDLNSIETTIAYRILNNTEGIDKQKIISLVVTEPLNLAYSDVLADFEQYKEIVSNTMKNGEDAYSLKAFLYSI